jgi:hypothetical protein
MASIQPAQGGFRWVKSQKGTSNTPPTVEICVASAYATAIYRGDFLKKIANGTAEVCAANESISYLCIGVKQYKDAGGVRMGSYLPAGTTYTGTISTKNPQCSVLLCIPVEDQIFEGDVLTGAATQTAATALIGQCVDIVANAGSTVTGQSGMTTLGVASFETTTTSGQLELMEIPSFGLSDNKQNDVTAAYWKGWFKCYETVTII